MLAIPSLLFAALRNPTAMICIAAALFTGYVGVKAYKAGYASAVSAQQAATDALNIRVDDLNSEQATMRFLEDKARDEAYTAAIEKIKSEGVACPLFEADLSLNFAN